MRPNGEKVERDWRQPDPRKEPRLGEKHWSGGWRGNDLAGEKEGYAGCRHRGRHWREGEKRRKGKPLSGSRERTALTGPFTFFFVCV